MAGSLRADGTLDFGSRVSVVDADLEYGKLKDHTAPRLVGDDVASLYVISPEDVGLTARAQPTLYWYQTAPAQLPFEIRDHKANLDAAAQRRN